MGNPRLNLVRYRVRVYKCAENKCGLVERENHQGH